MMGGLIGRRVAEVGGDHVAAPGANFVIIPKRPDMVFRVVARRAYLLGF
jgi:hypothetical protein